MKKQILAIFAFLLAPALLGALDREIVLTPGDIPPRSISAWALKDAVMERGWRGGWDIVIGPPPSSAGRQGAGGSEPVSLDFEWAEGRNPAPWVPAPGSSLALGPGRTGSSSGKFSGQEAAFVLQPGPSSVLAADRELRDFSVEFWLNPATTENGEGIFSWKASRWSSGKYQVQEMSCVFSNGRLSWTLLNCFAIKSAADHRLTFAGRKIVVPRTWSHHRLRFDFSTGLVEYLVDGVPEALSYATESGRDGDTVLIPMVGIKGELRVGEGYAGLLDGFRVQEEAAEGADLRLRAPAGADAWAPVIDTGAPGTSLLSLSAEFQVSGDTEIEFLLRAGESYADWTEDWPAWHRAIPGQALGEALKGRYIQARARLYTDGRARESPRLSRLSLVIREDLPPPPPSRVLAMPGDGAITLSWTPVPEADLGGYLVHYGNAPGEYFGSDASEGRSPLDAGRSTSLTLTGLANGRLYYIAISSYDTPVEGEPRRKREGELSAQAQARPLRPAR